MITACFVWSLVTISVTATAQEKLTQEAVASAAAHATQAGINILHQGGNAFDAAVAVSSVLSIVEPYNSGLGGGGFWLLHFADTNKNLVLDSREVAPLATRKSDYLDETHLLRGPLSAAIPGEAAAMVYIASHYGKLPLDVTLAPAVHFAEVGFKVGSFYRYAAKINLLYLKQSPAASMIFLDKGEIPKLGYVVKQPELAAIYRNMQYNGGEDFYHGLIARRLVSGVRRAGGVWQLRDLEDYQLKISNPLVMSVFGAKMITVPTPSVGGRALGNMLKNAEAQDYFAKSTFHRKQLLIKIMQHAMAEKFAPNVNVEVNDETTHFSILDREGNRVAATLSLNFHFGSSFVVPGTGILLNNHMADFSLEDNSINALRPGNRPLSSITPAFVETQDGVLIIGTPGGPRIPTMLLLALLDFFEHHNIANALSVPRFHYRDSLGKVEHEPAAFMPWDIDKLEQAGYQLTEISRGYGDMQAIYWNSLTGDVVAVSDPRRSGLAISAGISGNTPSSVVPSRSL